MSVTRRSVVRGAAWSVPVVAVAAQAPAYAASLCQPVPYQTNWAGPAVAGTLKSNSGATTYLPNYGGDAITRFVSEADNNSTGLETDTANTATVTVSRALTLVAGRQYTFTFTVASQFSNRDPARSQLEYLQVSIGGADRLQLVKRSANNTLNRAGYTSLGGGTNETNAHVQTVFFTFTPTAASNTLTYLFTLPARGKTGGGTWEGNADIGISAPTITGC